MSDSPIDTLGLSCPAGGDVYICQDSTVQFLGCCGIDPCKDGSGNCPASQLFESSFDQAKYHNILPQECVGSGGLWYTCTYGGQGDPFMGCCGSNPCSDASTACPKNDLVAARLNDDPYSAAPFMTQSRSPTSTSSTTSTTTATNTAEPTQDGPSTAPEPVGQGGSDESGLPTGAIVGIAVGAVTLLALVTALVFIYRKRKRGDKDNTQQSPQTPETTMNNPSIDPYYSPGKDSHLSTPTMVAPGPPSFYGGSQYPGQQYHQHAHQQQQQVSPAMSWAATPSTYHNKHTSHISSGGSSMFHGPGSAATMAPSEAGSYGGGWPDGSIVGIQHNSPAAGGGFMVPQPQYQQPQPPWEAPPRHQQVHELSNEAQRHEIGG